MTCTLCGTKKPRARGLCPSCYQKEKLAGNLDKYAKAKKPQMCCVDGCGQKNYSNGYCRNHYEQAKRGTLQPRKIASIPGEAWRKISGHPGVLVSTLGRVKSTRAKHERLMIPRIVDGRLLVSDHQHGDVVVHLAVLRTFDPDGEADDGRAEFTDANPLNVELTNLRWNTSTLRIAEAISMAETSSSKWASAFVAYWQGDKKALNQFFEEMWALLLSAYHRKACTWHHYYPAEAGEYASSSLFRAFLSIKRGSLTSLDNLPAWIMSIGDKVLLQHNLYAKYFTGIEVDGPEGDGNVMLSDVVGWHHPSAELVAISRETLQELQFIEEDGL